MNSYNENSWRLVVVAEANSQQNKGRFCDKINLAMNLEPKKARFEIWLLTARKGEV